MVIREVEVRGRERLDVFVPKGVYGEKWVNKPEYIGGACSL